MSTPTETTEELKPFRWDADLHNAFLISSRAFDREHSFVPKAALPLLAQEKEGIF